MGSQMSTNNSPVVCDGYVKYEETEVDRLAIMQYFQDNEEKMAAILDLFLWNLSGIILVRSYVLFHIHGPASFECCRYQNYLEFCFIFMVQIFCFVNQFIGWHSWAYLHKLKEDLIEKKNSETLLC